MAQKKPLPPPPERRRSDRQIRMLFSEVGEMKSRHEALVDKVDQNTAATLRVEKNTAEIVDAWKALSGGLKVLGWLGKVAKYTAYFLGLIGAAGSAWYALTHWGEPPQSPPQIHP